MIRIQFNFILTAFVTAVLFAGLMLWMTDLSLVMGNQGVVYAIFLVFLQLVISILLGINVAFLMKKAFDIRAGTATGLGSVLALIVSGCPTCGLTIAGYLGLGGFFIALPFEGLEIKMISIVLLLVSLYYLQKPTNCRVSYINKKNT